MFQIDQHKHILNQGLVVIQSIAGDKTIQERDTTSCVHKSENNVNTTVSLSPATICLVSFSSN
jgi:hypothetical protein